MKDQYRSKETIRQFGASATMMPIELGIPNPEIKIRIGPKSEIKGQPVSSLLDRCDNNLNYYYNDSTKIR